MESQSGLSRRRLIQAGAAGAALLWTPAFRVSAAEAQTGCPRPPRFPAGIELYRQAYENWSQAIHVDDLWTCAPRSAEQVLRIVNWARRHDYRVRPRGYMHNWSPLAVTAETGCDDRILLVDTTAGLTGSRMVSRSPAAVEVGAGESLLALTTYLESEGLGFAALPAPGEITVGGALAIGAHGTAVPATGERRLDGQTYGSLSNLVVSLEAVVWSERRGRYVLRRFGRSDPRIRALLVHLGRAFVTSCVLRCSENQTLRCVSLADVPSSELFAPPAEAGERSFSALLQRHGRVETIEFPFVDRPWLKYWSVAPRKPPASREVAGPYNYPFSHNLSPEASASLGELIRGHGSLTPGFGQTQYDAVVSGLAATDSADIWGPSKDVLFYIKASTLRLEEIGYCVLTRRSSVQRVLSEFYAHHIALRDSYASRGEYPVNGPLEIRVTGLDRHGHVGVEGAQRPSLSSLRRRRDRRHWHCAVWFNVLTFGGTPGEYRFMRDTERFLLANYRGSYAQARPEWSKCWAYTSSAQFANRGLIERTFPQRYSAGRPRSARFAAVRRELNRLDPHRIFSNGFLDELLP